MIIIARPENRNAGTVIPVLRLVEQEPARAEGERSAQGVGVRGGNEARAKRLVTVEQLSGHCAIASRLFLPWRDFCRRGSRALSSHRSSGGLGRINRHEDKFLALANW